MEVDARRRWLSKTFHQWISLGNVQAADIHCKRVCFHLYFTLDAFMWRLHPLRQGRIDGGDGLTIRDGFMFICDTG